MNERGHTNSVPWMYQLVQEILWLNWMKLTWRNRKTACIHGTVLVWPRSIMARSWCDRVSHGKELMRFGMRLVWFRKVTLCGFCVHCTLYSGIHLADFMLVFARKNPQIHLTESKNQHKVTLFSQSDCISYKAAYIGFCWWRPFKMILNKSVEPPVCHYGLNEPTLDA